MCDEVWESWDYDPDECKSELQGLLEEAITRSVREGVSKFLECPDLKKRVDDEVLKLCLKKVEEDVTARIDSAIMKRITEIIQYAIKDTRSRFQDKLDRDIRDAMEGTWNRIKARFIKAIQDRERIEAIRFGDW